MSVRTLVTVVAVTLSVIPGFVAGRYASLLELRERVASAEAQLEILKEVCR